MREADRQARSIRAAREWLGEAEASIEADEGVRGNLKVMLAEAELAHMRKGKGRTGRLGKVLMPLALALCITAGFAVWHRAEAPVPAPHEPPAAATEQASADLSDGQPESAAQEEQRTLASEDVARIDEPAGVHPKEMPQEGSLHATTPTRPLEEKSHLDDKPKAPDAGMQRLMQTAGKALRE